MPTHATSVITLIALCTLILTSDLSIAHDDAPPPSISKTIGKIDFSTSCMKAQQQRFQRGLALMHHMMYKDALHEFQEVTTAAPNCAMAHWGIAMTYLHPLWVPPSQTDLQKGAAAIAQAKRHGTSTDRETAYIAAAEAFFGQWETIDHKTRLTSWEAAQKRLYTTYPDDIDAGALYALAHLATAPKADKSFSHQKAAGEILETLHTKAPQHPGLFHYIIHAYDNPVLAQHAVKVARGYNVLAPQIPHALHMPTHIFVRLGLWDDVIDWNIRSASAATSTNGIASLHRAHAQDYMMYAYLQQGKDIKADQILRDVTATHAYQDSFVSAYAIAAVQARPLLERSEWAKAASLPVRIHRDFPWDNYPWFEALTYFARGLGAARNHDAVAASQAITWLDGAYDRAIEAGRHYWSVLIDAQRQTIAAWVTWADGDADRALQLMHDAADTEDSVDKHPVTPSHVLPTRELYGEMLILAGKPSEALQAYEIALRTSPNRFNALHGAGQASELAGNVEQAKSFYRQLLKLTADAEGKRPELANAVNFLAKYDLTDQE